jgi:hypothetical protein
MAVAFHRGGCPSRTGSNVRAPNTHQKKPYDRPPPHPRRQVVAASAEQHGIRDADELGDDEVHDAALAADFDSTGSTETRSTK